MILIRPWFLILLVVPFLLWFFKKGLARDTALSAFVDKKLLPFVTVHFAAGKRRKTAKMLGIFWTILVLAGSGPAFVRTEAPALVSAPGTVIVMDLSPAMNGASLNQAKLKLYDLLNALKGHQVGLVLYDEKGYVASPLTQDIGIVRGMVSGLSPDVLPRSENQPEKGFLKAVELFQNAGAPTGQIIFITTGGFNEGPLIELSKKIAYQVATLGIGNVGEGTPVPLPEGGFLKNEDGSIVVAKLNPEVLTQIGLFVQATPDSSDVWEIMAQSKPDSEAQNAPDNTAVIWQDLGPFILLCLAPFFVFLFRRGVLFLLVFGLSLSAEAGLFLRPDQEAYQEQKVAVAAYRAEDFEQAKLLFSKGVTADAAYNTGNALAHLNDIQGAIAAYKKALSFNPAHEEAKFNKEYLEKQLPPQEPSSNSNDSQNQNQSPQDESSQSSESAENQQDNPAQENASSDSPAKSEQEASQNILESQVGQESSQDSLVPKPDDAQQNDSQSEENQSEELGEASEKPASEVSQQAATVDGEGQSKQPQPSVQFDQESQQLFNRIQRDPSRLLRYRLYQQSQRDEE